MTINLTHTGFSALVALEYILCGWDVTLTHSQSRRVIKLARKLGYHAEANFKTYLIHS